MNFNSMPVKILMFIISLALIAIIIIAVVASSNDSSNPDTSGTDEGVLAPQTFTDYVADGRVSVEIAGPIVAREQHYRVRVEVSANERVIEVSRGYGDSAIERRRYPNDRAAFREFLNALKIFGLENEKASTVGVEGYCSSGERYTYDFESPLYDMNRWSNSCDLVGTLPANGRQIRKLFRDQIPDYTELVTPLEPIDYHFRVE